MSETAIDDPYGPAHPPARIHGDLAEDPRPATTARHFVRETLASWGEPDGLVEIVELAASELVANAVRHGGGVTALALARIPGGTRVEVNDRNTAAPVVLHPGVSDEGHRGMLIVESVSARWGHRSFTSGKTVWAEFTRAA